MLAYVVYKWYRIARMVVRPYPTYLCWREQMNILSTVERRIFLSALLVRWYLLKIAEVMSKAYRSSVIWELVELARLMGTEPGLTGTMKVVDNTVL